MHAPPQIVAYPSRAVDYDVTLFANGIKLEELRTTYQDNHGQSYVQVKAGDVLTCNFSIESRGNEFADLVVDGILRQTFVKLTPAKRFSRYFTKVACYIDEKRKAPAFRDMIVRQRIPKFGEFDLQ
jgi:hypothetical protein